MEVKLKNIKTKNKTRAKKNETSIDEIIGVEPPHDQEKDIKQETSIDEILELEPKLDRTKDKDLELELINLNRLFFEDLQERLGKEEYEKKDWLREGDEPIKLEQFDHTQVLKLPVVVEQKDLRVAKIRELLGFEDSETSAFVMPIELHPEYLSRVRKRIQDSVEEFRKFKRLKLEEYESLVAAEEAKPVREKVEKPTNEKMALEFYPTFFQGMIVPQKELRPGNPELFKPTEAFFRKNKNRNMSELGILSDSDLNDFYINYLRSIFDDDSLALIASSLGRRLREEK